MDKAVAACALASTLLARWDEVAEALMLRNEHETLQRLRFARSLYFAADLGHEPGAIVDRSSNQKIVG